MANVVIFWLALVTSLELWTARTYAQASSLGFFLICLLGALLLLGDVDLLGSLILAVYSSVFLLATLVLIARGGLWKNLEPPVVSSSAGLALSLGSAFLSPRLCAGAWNYAPPASSVGCSQPTLFAEVTHTLAYRAYALDSVVLNWYLVLGMSLAALVSLDSRSSPSNRARPKVAGDSGRRLTRRKNSSTSRARTRLECSPRPRR